MLNGMLWITRSGAQWRELPEAYGPWQSVYARFAKWRDDGTLETVFYALSEDADRENLSMDSTCVEVHESANGGGKKEDKAVGRTRGGLNTKVHAVVDGLGNPVEFPLPAGNDHESVHAIELLEKVSDPQEQCTGRLCLRYPDGPGIDFRAWGQLCDPPTKQCSRQENQNRRRLKAAGFPYL